MARPKGNRESTVARREAILEAGLEIFGRNGYNGASLTQVADLVGITDATVVHHFGSKRQLMLDVLARRDEITREQLRTNEDSGISYICGWLDLVEYNTNHAGIVELYTVLAAEATMTDHPAHDYFINRYHYIFGRLRETFDQLAGKGHLATSRTSDELAQAITALSDGLQVQWLLNRNTPVMEHHKHFLQNILTPEAWELVLQMRSPLPQQELILV